MAPAVTQAQSIKDTFGKAADALETYASELSGVKADLERIEKEANAFRELALAEGPGDAWRENGEYIERNENLLSQYAGTLSRISGFVAECANTINGLVTGSTPERVESYSAESILAWTEAPWGAPVEEKRNCGESVVHGAGNFLKSTWDGARAMVGFGEDGWSWSTMGNTWLGVADFVGSTVLLTSPVLSSVIKMAGNDDVDAWVDRRQEVAMTAWTGMVGFDYATHKAGGDGWHKWKEDWVAALTESGLNVGTMFIPGAGPAGAGVRVATASVKATMMMNAGVKLVNFATRAADFALPAGGWAIRGGVRVVNLASDAIRGLGRVDVPELPDVPRPAGGPGLGSVVDGGAGGRPASLPDAPDGVGSGGPGRAPAVSDGAGSSAGVGGRAAAAAAVAAVGDAADGRPEVPGAGAVDDAVADAAGAVDDAVVRGAGPRPGSSVPDAADVTGPESRVDGAPGAGAVDAESVRAGEAAEPVRAPEPVEGVADAVGEAPESVRAPEAVGAGVAAELVDETGPRAGAEDPGRPTGGAASGGGELPPGERVPAVDGVPDQRLVDPEQVPDRQRLGYDEDGRPLVTDRGDGKPHWANDPPDTFRDVAGRLHDKAAYTSDPYSGESRIDYLQDMPERGPVEVEPEYRERWDAANEEWGRVREEARQATVAADAAVARAAGLGVDIKGKSRTQLVLDIREILSDGSTPHVAELLEIEFALDKEKEMATRARKASEWVGDFAGSVRDAQLNRTAVLGESAHTFESHSSTGAGRIDRASISEDGRTLYLGENKGGDSPSLGSRKTADGTRATQGSPEYFADLLAGVNQDPRLLDALLQLEASGVHPEFFNALRGDGVQVVAEMVNVRTSGNIRAGMFAWDARLTLRLDGDRLVASIEKG